MTDELVFNSFSLLNEAKMTRKMFMVLAAVLAMDLSPCFCQFGGEMGGAMGEMMAAGGMGGLGPMMGGGMGGLGPMMGSGIGALMGEGGGSMGLMIPFIGSMIRQGAMAGAENRINEAVRSIVGPNATPDKALLDFVMSKRSPPRTASERMSYLPHFQRIARATYGAWLADMAAKDSAPTSSANSSSTGGKSLTQLQADLDSVIMQRAMEYSKQSNSQQSAAGPGGMAGMGAMMQTIVPAMIQGMAASYM